MKKDLRMHSGRIARLRQRWSAIGLAGQLGILGLAVAILGLVPAYLALFDNQDSKSSSAAAPSGATTTSLQQPSGQGALQLDAAYIRAPESIMWATAQSLPPEDDAVIQAPNLAGNDPAQNAIAALLLERGGVKIESDETEENREHSQVRLVVTGQHERPVLVSVKPGEQVVFTVRAFTSKCYCEWELLIEAVVDGKEQMFRVKDGNQPFRTTAFAKSYETIYSFDFFGRNRFVKLPPGTQSPPPQSGP
jgi:hypothetical protein